MAASSVPPPSHDMDICLFDLMRNQDRDQMIKNNWNFSMHRCFKSRKDFFQRLNHVHEDTLKAFSVRQLTKGESSLSKFLLSSYAALPNEKFVECNGVAVNLEIDQYVTARLSYIQEHHRPLIFPTTPSESADTPSPLSDKKISLRQIRNLDSEQKIADAFTRFRFSLILLSSEQKKRIEEQQLFEELMRADTVEEKGKYLPLHTPEFLTQKLLNFKHFLPQMPYETLPMFNLSTFSDKQVDQLMYNNLQHLDKLSISDEGLHAILQRLLRMSMTKENFRVLLENGTERHISTPVFYPHLWERIPDSVFRRIPFQELDQEELFCLFHPSSFANEEKFGAVVIKKWWGRAEVIHYTSCTSFCTRLYGMGGYSGLVKYKREYNERRLALLSSEQYQLIRPRLDPEIVKLGDALFPQ